MIDRNRTGKGTGVDEISADGRIADETPALDEHRHHDRRALIPQLSRQRQWALWSIVGLLVLTGAAWLWAEYLYLPADGGMEPYEIKHYAMVVHAGFALLFVFAAGSLLYTHMQSAWRQERNRASGAAMALTAFVLVGSGYGLWYAGGETLRAAAEIAHWITGFAIPVLMLVHGILGKRRRRPAPTRHDPGVPVP